MERVVGLHQRGRLVDAGVVDQAVQAAELLGGFDGAGPIGFRGHIVPDERSRLSSLSMCRPLKVQGTSIADRPAPFAPEP